MQWAMPALRHHRRCRYDAGMRTTVDLPPAVHRRALEIAGGGSLALGGGRRSDHPRSGSARRAGRGQYRRTLGVPRHQRWSSGHLGAGRCGVGRGVTTYLLDANVLIALTVAEHEHHERGRRLGSRDHRFALCPVVEGALVRFLVRIGESARGRAAAAPRGPRPTRLRVLAGLAVLRRCRSRSRARSPAGHRRVPREPGRRSARWRSRPSTKGSLGHGPSRLSCWPTLGCSPASGHPSTTLTASPAPGRRA